MRTFAAKEARDKFGELMAAAFKAPVSIFKNGRPALIVMAQDEYDKLQAESDAYWLRRAEESHKKGYLSYEESEKIIQEMLNAED